MFNETNKEMKKLFLLLTAFVLGHFSFAQYQYPVTKTVDVSETIFGTVVEDPYRWLEDIKNEEVVDWFKTQAAFTNSEMSKISNQNKLIEELKQYDAMRSVAYYPIAKAGGKYFYEKRLPNEQVYKVYYRQGRDGEEILLFDPQKFKEGKTYDFSASVNDEGSKIALNLSEAGAEVGDIYILDVATVKFLPEVIPHSDGLFMEGNNTEIFYNQYKGYDVHDTEQLLNMPCKLHTVNTPVENDLVIVSSENNPELNIKPEVIPVVYFFRNSPYMVLVLYTVDIQLTSYYAQVSELKSGNVNWKPLTTRENEVRNLFVKENDVYLITSKGNPRFKIIKTSFTDPDLNKAVTIAEGDKEWQISIDYLAETKDYFVFNKSKNELITKTYQYEYATGMTSEVDVPLEGNVMPYSLSRDDNELILRNRGWTTPLNIYSYDAATKEFSKGVFNMKFEYPNLGNIVYEEVEVPSWDGTLVPLSIVYDKNKFKKDGSNIVYMSGYGAYGINAYIPAFNAIYFPLLNRGVVLAFAHVRGGGEKGSEWYHAGKKSTKPNTWKDFNACAEWLIKNKYTSPDKFGISGVSAGGILIGRAITERPDLYKVAIPKVGALNSLREEFTPGGPVNIPEFGTITIEEEFRALMEMDAYHNISKGVEYPAQFITTGFNDPRVTSYIPAKFAARMQNANGSQNPVFLDVDYKSGHFGGSTVDEQFKQLAKEFAFLLWQCGDEEFQKVE